MVKNLPAKAGDTRDAALIPGLGRSPGIGSDNPPQYSCLENSMDRGAWRAISHEVTKSQTSLSLSLSHTHTHTHAYKLKCEESKKFRRVCILWVGRQFILRLPI